MLMLLGVLPVTVVVVGVVGVVGVVVGVVVAPPTTILVGASSYPVARAVSV